MSAVLVAFGEMSPITGFCCFQNPTISRLKGSKTPWQNYGTFAVIVPHLKFFIRYPLAGPSAAQVIEVTKSLKKMIYFRS